MLLIKKLCTAASVLVCLSSVAYSVTFNQIDAPASSTGQFMPTCAWQRIGNQNVLAVGNQVVHDILDLYTASFDINGTLKLTKQFTSPNLSETRVNGLSWQEYYQSYYLAVGGNISSPTTESVQLYRYTNNIQLQKVGAISSGVISGETLKVAWQTIDGVPYLAALGNYSSGTASPIRLIRLTSDVYGNQLQFSQVYSVPTTTTNGAATSCSWLSFNGTYYLAIGGNFTDLGGGTQAVRLFSFSQDMYGNPLLVERFKVSTSIVSASSSPKLNWTVINGTPYLGVGTATTGTSLFVFKLQVDEYGNAQLVQKATRTVGRVYGNVTWTSIPGMNILTTIQSSSDPVVQLFSVTVDNSDNVTISSLTSVPISVIFGSAFDGSWYNIGNRYFFALTGNISSVGTQALRLFELVTSSALSITQTVDSSTPVGGQIITFTISVSNNGPDSAIATQVFDMIPEALTFISATPSTGSYNATSGIWDLGTLAANSTATLQIAAQVQLGSTGSTITNTASVFDPYTIDTYMGNNSASVTIDVPSNFVAPNSQLVFNILSR